MDDIKQKAIDALELLKAKYLAEWELHHASKIEDIILRIEDMD